MSVNAYFEELRKWIPRCDNCGHRYTAHVGPEKYCVAYDPSGKHHSCECMQYVSPDRVESGAWT